MFEHSLAFDRPGYLALLAVIPLLWFIGRQSLSALGAWRKYATLAFRSLVAGAIVLALADVQYQRKSDGLTVVYLLDQSLSIPAAQRQAMLEYVSTTLDEHAQAERDDRFAVIAFARDAEVEIPPMTAALAPPARMESLLDPELSDLATAIQRAQAMFPQDAARRIMLVTDGNENAGNAYRQARAAADGGVSIDVVPVYLAPRDEVSVEKIDVPPNVRRGQPFDLRIVVQHETAEDDGRQVAGRVHVVRKSGEREETIADEAVNFGPGKHVLAVREELDQSDFYTYEAKFIADDAAADGATQNNVATAFTHIRGSGHVLLIENAEQRGEFDFLVERLRSQSIEVTVTATDRLFNSLVELQRYDAVVLANVPRSSIDAADSDASFSDEQIEMLVRNTRELGCGLVMLGGPDSFGAGGWANTKLEEAMPVDFQIKASKVIPVGALSIVIDRSGSMAGQKLAMSKAAAIEAVRVMGRRDFISVVAFDGAPTRTVSLQRVDNYTRAARRIDLLGTGGGTDMFPGMATGFAELRKANAAVKHMIVLTDGQTPAADFDRLVRDMRRANISVTAVAVGADANVPLLQQIATSGGGKFYLVRNPRGLPRIFLREVRRVARPLVYEPPAPVTPQIVGDHEILHGVEGGMPPVSGLVLTSVKKSPLVEVLLRSPQPVTEDNSTLLATWTYGAGKTAVLTTDAGVRWASSWTKWEGYDKFFSQLVRWSMRPTGGNPNFAVATDVREGVTHLVVTAVDDEGAAINDRSITAQAVAPDMTSVPIAMEQSAPGRYVGQFPSEQAGSYLVVVNTGAGEAPIRTGVSVGYSPEYRDRETNLALLQSLAKLTARGGHPGKLYRQGLDADAVREPNADDPFRRDLPAIRSSQSVWPWFVVAGSCLFWCDVFMRRVQLDLAWLALLAVRLRERIVGRAAKAAEPETMERLRSRKREVNEQFVSRTFQAQATVDDGVKTRVAAAPPETEPLPKPRLAASEEPESDRLRPETYTERLLKAKKDAWRDRP